MYKTSVLNSSQSVSHRLLQNKGAELAMEYIFGSKELWRFSEGGDLRRRDHHVWSTCMPKSCPGNGEVESIIVHGEPKDDPWDQKHHYKVKVSSNVEGSGLFKFLTVQKKTSNKRSQRYWRGRELISTVWSLPWGVTYLGHCIATCASVSTACESQNRYTLAWHCEFSLREERSLVLKFFC